MPNTTGGVEGSNDAGRVTVGVGGGVDRVSIRQAAALLGVHQNTVRQRVKAGVYKAEKVDTKHGPTWLIDRASLSSHASVMEPHHPAAGPYDEPAQRAGATQVGKDHESVVKPRWRTWVFAPLRLLARPLVALYNWSGSEEKSVKAAVRISELAALIALFVAVLSWLHSAPQRQLERELGAWQVIDVAKGAHTSSARIIALQLLVDAGVSLNGLDLADTDLTGIDLANADMQSADLGGADLSGADLEGADLEGANLNGKTNLDNADLSKANLVKTDLSDVDLRHATLIGTDLSGATLMGTYLFGADLGGADLSGAILEAAYLFGADLSGANLSGAHLNGATLTGADLSYADLGGANLSYANLSETKGVTEEQIEWTLGSNETQLPQELSRPALWSKSYEEQVEIITEHFSEGQ